jgi:uncharacterized protein (DUF1330 family)
MSTYIEPTKDHLEAVRVHPHEGPVVMLNLLRFDFDDDGEARFSTYVEKVVPLLRAHGAEIVYAGGAAETVIGGEAWDRVILVRYPTTRAFLEMIEGDAYQSIARHRNEALLDSRLYMTIPG